MSKKIKLTDDSRFFIDEYKQLIGKTIKGIAVSQNLDFQDIGLEFMDGTVAWVQCDPEGNGPGFLAIDNAKE